MPHPPAAFSDLSLVPLVDRTDRRSSKDTQPSKPSGAQSLAAPAHHSSYEVPRALTLAQQIEGPWSYKKQPMSAVVKPTPPLQALPPLIPHPPTHSPQLDFAPSVASTAVTRVSPQHAMFAHQQHHPNHHQQHHHNQQQQWEVAVPLGAGGGSGNNAFNSVQRNGGNSTAAAEVASLKLGYRAIEAAHVQSLQALKRMHGPASMDSAQIQALQRAGAEEEAQLLQQHQQQQQQQAFHPHPQQPPGLPPLDKEKSAARLSRYATCYSEHPSGALGDGLQKEVSSASLFSDGGGGPHCMQKGPMQSVFESIAGHLYDPVVDGLRQIDGSADLPAAPAHTITRKALLLKMPVLDDAMRMDIPGTVEDRSGHTCLIILPADKPPARGEALAVERLLKDLLKEPMQAAHKASAWRTHVLSLLCSDAMGDVRKGVYGSYLNKKMTRHPWVLNAANLRATSLTPELLGPEMPSANAVVSNVVEMLQEESSKASLHSEDSKQQQPASASAKKSFAALARKHALPKAKKSAEDEAREKEIAAAEENISHQKTLATINMAVAASILLADVIRQVEVGCGDRGRVLAYIWNAYLTTHEDTVWRIHKENTQLIEENAKLKKEVKQLTCRLNGLDFLRREVVRFRKMINYDEYQSGELLRENLNFRAVHDDTAKALQAIEMQAHRQLAALRWQYAFHILGTREKRVLIVSGGLGDYGDLKGLTQKVAMVRDLSVAVEKAAKLKRAFGIFRKAADFEQGATYSEVVKSSLGTAYQSQWDAGSASSLEEVMQKLPNLQSEAQVLVLASMKQDDRRNVFQSLTPEQRAKLLVVMSPQMQMDFKKNLPLETWRETLDTMKQSNEIAALLLPSLESQEGAYEFQGWALEKQAQVLADMDAKGAHAAEAEIMKRLPDSMRLGLLSYLGTVNTGVGARSIQALGAKQVLSSLDGIQKDVKYQVIMAMDSPYVSQVLSEMNYEEAAKCLLLEKNPDRRAAILEDMPHKTAANVLIYLSYLDDLEQQRLEMMQIEADAAAANEASVTFGGEESDGEGLFGSPKPKRERFRRTSIAGATLMSMKKRSASGIMGHISYEDRTSILTTMDPDKVASMMALMPAEEAVALLAVVSDVSLSVLREKLPKHEKERLMQALSGDMPKKSKRGTSSLRSSPIPAKGSSPQPTRSYKTSSPQPVDHKDHSEHQVSINVLRKEDMKIMQSEAMDDAITDQERPPRPPASDSSSEDAESSSSGSSDAASEIVAPTSKGKAKKKGKGNKASVSNSNSVASSPGTSRRGSIDVPHAKPRRGSMDVARRGSIDQPSPLGSKPQRRAKSAAPRRGGASHLSPSAVQERDSDDEDQAEGGSLRHSGSGADDDTDQVDHLGTLMHRRSKPQSGAHAPYPDHQAGFDNRRALLQSDSPDQEQAGGGVRHRSHQSGAKHGPSHHNLTIEIQEDSGADFDSEATSGSRNSTGKKKAPKAGGGGSDSAANTPQTTTGKGQTPTSTTSAGVPTPLRKVLALRAMASGGTSLGLQKHMKNAIKDMPGGKATIDAAAARAEASALEAEAWKEMLESNGGELKNLVMEKLGDMPKNLQLLESLMTHKHEAPRPKGWLLAVVDAVYKEGESMVRKQGRSEVVRKHTMPEIVFFYFMNTYGQKKVASKYIGSLINSLMLHRTTDQRLENFGKFLVEEWDTAVFIDFLAASSMLAQPVKIMCAEYPTAHKDEGYVWACYHKCMYVAEAVIGPCSPEVRDRFQTLCFAQCEEVDAETMERARREKKPGPMDVFPSHLYRIHRSQFLRLLCKELQRINTFIAGLAQAKFARLDIQKKGEVSVDASMPTYTAEFLPPYSPADVVASAQLQLVQFAAACEQNMPVTEIEMESVDTIREGYCVQATVHNVPIRQHVKMSLLKPAPVNDDKTLAELQSSYLMGVVRRHANVFIPLLYARLTGGSADKPIRDQASALSASDDGDTRFKAFLQLLAGVVNTKVTLMVESIVAMSKQDADMSSAGLEASIGRLEDMALTLLNKEEFLTPQYTSNNELLLGRIARLPSALRIRHLGAVCVLNKAYMRSMQAHAACVLQGVWRARQAQFRLAEAVRCEKLVASSALFAPAVPSSTQEMLEVISEKGEEETASSLPSVSASPIPPESAAGSTSLSPS